MSGRPALPSGPGSGRLYLERVPLRRLAVASLLISIGLVAGAAAAVARQSSQTGSTLGPGGVANVRFGLTKSKAVARLTGLFGTPSARGANTGCGPRYSEVEWGDLAAEFRLGRFSGFRYLKGGWPLTTPGSPRESPPPKRVWPRLTTANGISLGSTLAQLRAAYGAVLTIGTGRWRSANGLVFVVGAKGSPRRIAGIKIGTCGDF